MKNQSSFVIVFVVILFSSVLLACSAIKGIFEAGVWTGIMIVGVIFLLVIFLLSRSNKK